MDQPEISDMVEDLVTFYCVLILLLLGGIYFFNCKYFFQETMIVTDENEYNQFSLEKQQKFIKKFESWPEHLQDNFVQQLLSRMNHYQHSRINAFLKPMLQRDFISLLPSKYLL